MGCNSSKAKTKEHEYKHTHHGKIMSGYISAIGHKAVTIREPKNREWYAPLNKFAPELKNCSYEELLHKKVNFRANTRRYSGHQASGPRYYASEITNFAIIL